MSPGTQAEIEDIYRELDLPMTDSFRAGLAKQGKRARDHHLQHLLHEVLETERNYVEDLTKAIEHYFKPLRLLAHTKEKLLDADAVAAIFGNLEDVLVIAEELLARIEEEVGSGGSSLGPIFKAHSFALKLYARYVSGYEDATERLRG